jgi:Trp operon repressor
MTAMMMMTASSSRTVRRGFRATPSADSDIREALNAAFSFRPTPQSLEADALMAKTSELPAGEFDFDLQLPLLKAAIQQHKKDDVIRLMQDLARANPVTRASIQERVERYTKKMEEQMMQAHQKATASSNAAKITANAKNIDTTASDAKDNKTSSGAPTGTIYINLIK